MSQDVPPPGWYNPPQGQYLFIYDAVLHALVLGNTELGMARLKEHLAALSQAAGEEGEEGEGLLLEKEFKVCVCVCVCHR